MKHLIIASLFLIGSQITFATENVQNISIAVTDSGFEPEKINVKPGAHVVLKVTRKSDATCATKIQIKEKKIKKDLPLNQEISVDVGTLQKGEIRFACGMDMVSGHIIAE